MPTPLLPRVSIVTGAGSGIAKALAAALARRGSHVVVADIDAQSAAATVEAIERAGAREDRLAAKGR